MEDKIVIPVSKAKIIQLFAGAALFVLAGIWILLDPQFGIFQKIIASACILFFGIAMIIFPRKLFDNTQNLVIDRYGITDNITRPRAGTIEWNDITHVEITKISGNKMLLIFVIDPEKYLSRVKAKGLRNNYYMAGTPFVIPSSMLKIKLNDLESLINTGIKEYHHACKP
ncbi:MAG: hypothetical protein LBQ60_05350 [Bacteroidales bacterium]|jgi:hypothetical protein|nr:hypothetical protein [Bacteroidales bacterium]